MPLIVALLKKISALADDKYYNVPEMESGEKK